MPEAERKRLQIWQDLLSQACRAHGWRMAVLAQEDGLPVVAVPDGESTEALVAAAVSAQIQRAANLVRRGSSCSSLTQLTLTLDDGSRMVGRCFTAGGEEFVLLVVFRGRRAYREAMEQTIQALVQAWERA